MKYRYIKNKITYNDVKIVYRKKTTESDMEIIFIQKENSKLSLKKFFSETSVQLSMFDII